MKRELLKDWYRVWFEYLIRAPFFQVAVDEGDCLFNRGIILENPEYYSKGFNRFFCGYSWWWGNNILSSWSFDLFWSDNSDKIYELYEKSLYSEFEYKYKFIQDGYRGTTQLNVLSRQLFYYHLVKIDKYHAGAIYNGLFYDKGEYFFRDRTRLPFGLPPEHARTCYDNFIINKYYNNDFTKPRLDESDVIRHIKKEIGRAQTVVDAVQKGFFPFVPK